MKIFVITETSFDYNDEYYYQRDSKVGQPIEAYSTKEKAQEAIPVRTKAWLKQISTSKWGGLTSYGDIDGVINIDQFANEAGLDYTEVLDAFSNYDEIAVDEMVINNIDAAVKALKLIIFKVTEIELNETSITF